MEVLVKDEKTIYIYTDFPLISDIENVKQGFQSYINFPKYKDEIVSYYESELKEMHSFIVNKSINENFTKFAVISKHYKFSIPCYIIINLEKEINNNFKDEFILNVEKQLVIRKKFISFYLAYKRFIDRFSFYRDKIKNKLKEFKSINVVVYNTLKLSLAEINCIREYLYQNIFEYYTTLTFAKMKQELVNAKRTYAMNDRNIFVDSEDELDISTLKDIPQDEFDKLTLLYYLLQKKNRDIKLDKIENDLKDCCLYKVRDYEIVSLLRFQEHFKINEIHNSVRYWNAGFRDGKKAYKYFKNNIDERNALLMEIENEFSDIF
ncbi:MAG: hypothetical protein QW607_07830 [Desulfurococcaceae archaeon]